MNTNDLKTFLISFSKNGYAKANESSWKKEVDGSTTIAYHEDDWSGHDNFFGGEPYGGREIIFYKNKPLWIMVYYGWVEKSVTDVNGVYAFLRKALNHMPEDMPLRGPASLKDGNFVYTNQWEGTLENFSGKESIEEKDTIVFTTRYAGGLVDRREGV